MARKTSTVYERYWAADWFGTHSIFRGSPGTWLVTGVGFPWLGEPYATWDDALEAVIDYQKEISA